MSSQIIKKSQCRGLKLERLEARDVPTVTAVADSYTTTEDQPFPFQDENGNLPSVLSNDSDDLGEQLTATIARQPERGTLVLNEDGTFFYTPEADDFGVVSFDYVATNETMSSSSQATVTITIEAVNDTPFANDIQVETALNTPVTVVPSGIDGLNEVAPLTAAISDLPEHAPLYGTVALDGSGNMVYTPGPNFTDSDSFFYTLTDGENTSQPARVTVVASTPTGNTAPVAVNDGYSVREDRVLNVGVLGGVLANDSDAESDALTASIASQPSNGTLTLASDGSFSYRPDANFHGQDTFTYTVTDTAGAVSTGVVTIEVRSVNDAPVALADAIATDEDSAFSGMLHGTDVEGDFLSYSAVRAPNNGTVVVHANGSFTYTPNANFHGRDSFTFRVNDGARNSRVARISVTVASVNDAPTLSPAVFGLAENSPNGTSVGTVGASDVDGGRLIYSIVGGNTGGAFEIDRLTGAIAVANAAALDFETTQVFDLVVRATDRGGLFGQATVTVNLSNVNEGQNVSIDVAPNSGDNRIRLSDDVVQVAILSNAAFDARQVNLDTLRFGRTGQEDSTARNNLGRVISAVRDVNGDGRLDLVVTFNIAATRFVVEDTAGFLSGRLNNGTLFSGSDSVLVRRGR